MTLANATRSRGPRLFPKNAERLFRVQKRLPLRRRAVKGVAVDMPPYAGDRAVRLVLPEAPGAAGIFDRRMMLRGAHPDRIVGEGAVRQDRLVEIDARIDDRPAAVMALHLVEHHLHIGDGGVLL